MISSEPPATPDAILALRGEEGFSPAAARRALELALAPPDAPAWGRFLDRSLLVLGAALVTAGILFFFAYNWDALGRFAKLGLVEAAVAAAALGAWRVGLDRLAGQALLTVAAVLVGPLLGVYGQIYQTGADEWELFAAWTVLVLPWAWAGRSAGLAGLLLVLLNLTLGLAWDQAFHGGTLGDASFHLGMAGLNGLLWVTWEGGRRRSPEALPPSWASRILGGLTLAFLVVPSCQAVLDDLEGLPAVALALLAATLVGIFRLSRPRDRDLFLPALGLGAAISVITCGLGRLLLDRSDAWEAGLLLLGLLVIGQAAAAAAWLRRLGAEP